LDNFLEDGDVDGGWDGPDGFAKRVDAVHHVVETLELERVAEQVCEDGEEQFRLIGVEILAAFEQVGEVVEDAAAESDTSTVKLFLLCVIASRVLHMLVTSAYCHMKAFAGFTIGWFVRWGTDFDLGHC
jgi:hypothetical protein